MISVVMPVYNVEKSLRKAVASVLNQTYKELELILVDDGSTDTSGRICDELVKEDNRISVIHKENRGLSSARNAGIEKASMEYITFIDSDDYFELDVFEKFIEKKQTDTEVFVFNVRRISDKTIRNLDSIDEVVLDNEQSISHLFLHKGTDFYAWNKIYAKSLFSSIRYPEGHLYEDIVPSFRLILAAKKVQFTTFIGYNYIQNTASIVNADFNPKQYDNVEQRVILLELVKKQVPNLEPLAYDKLIDGFLSTGYKLSLSKGSNHTKEYYKILKTDIKKYKNTVLLQNISMAKKIALKILQINLFLYGKMYKIYLGK
ncbi:glycosyltransferase family 2 protein [Marinilactibacillus sp. XAAS-LB27]|uniref:glycosyltransferase family 2 protein n=1 Tax=Marinilactibacillus sp. XAAS-LB27 TaxID=3114538 RepID=UPI002E1791F2|nr:glycosyltransferase family 2 protein [Marinilactibacillus sp. XAAS-LB27]